MANEQEKANSAPGREQTVIVNGRPKLVTSKELSFSDVVALSGLPGGPNVVFTVTFTRAEGNKPQGTLVEGQLVKVKDGMVFNVTATDKS